jgi:Gas vesicle synthesis protein GvpO
MPEQRQSTQRRNGAGQTRLSGREVIERVREEFPELFGGPIEEILGLEPDEDGGWKAMVQVVELSRIPHSTDVLGSYEVTLDNNGELVGWRQSRRYFRNQTNED